MSRHPESRVKSSFSLRFEDKLMEAGFLDSRKDSLRSLNMFGAVLVILGSVFIIGMILERQAEHEYRDVDAGARVDMLQMNFNLAVIVLFSLQFLNAYFRIVLNFCGTRVWEATSVLAILCAAASTLFDRWYVVKIFLQVDPTEVWQQDFFADTRVLITLQALIGITCRVPIRWMLSLPTCGVIFVIWIYLCFIVGSPEPGVALFQAQIFIIFLAVELAGARSSERKERALFSVIVDERTLRLETEHQLSAVQESLQTSLVKDPTVASAAMDAVSEADRGRVLQQLQTVKELGSKEHWLVDSLDLKLNHDESLGAGGFGQVITGKLHHSPVAAKLAKTDSIDGHSRSLTSLGSEVRLLRRLRHQNIVAFHGAHVVPESFHLALVLELVRGPSLGAHIVSLTSPSVPERLATMLGIIRAVQYLHGHLIIHGDIKDSNILLEVLDSGIRPKLLDFGLSRLMPSQVRGGTPMWMAPELLLGPILGRSSEMTYVDIYSFALLVHFIVSGQKVLASYSRQELVQQFQDKQPLCLDWTLACFSVEPMVDIANRCVSLEPTERPFTVDVLAHVEQLHHHLNVQIDGGFMPACRQTGPGSLSYSDSKFEEDAENAEKAGVFRQMEGHEETSIDLSAFIIDSSEVDEHGMRKSFRAFNLAL